MRRRLESSDDRRSTPRRGVLFLDQARDRRPCATAPAGGWEALPCLRAARAARLSTRWGSETASAGHRTSDQQVGGSNPSGRASTTHAAAVLDRTGCMTPRRSVAWSVTFRVVYALLRLLDPLLRWTWFSVGIGITSKLSVSGRRTGRERSVLVGLIRVTEPGTSAIRTARSHGPRTCAMPASARLAPRPEAPVDVTAVAAGEWCRSATRSSSPPPTSSRFPATSSTAPRGGTSSARAATSDSSRAEPEASGRAATMGATRAYRCYGKHEPGAGVAGLHAISAPFPHTEGGPGA